MGIGKVLRAYICSICSHSSSWGCIGAQYEIPMGPKSSLWTVNVCQSTSQTHVSHGEVNCSAHKISQFSIYIISTAIHICWHFDSCRLRLYNSTVMVHDLQFLLRIQSNVLSVVGLLFKHLKADIWIQFILTGTVHLAMLMTARWIVNPIPSKVTFLFFFNFMNAWNFQMIVSCTLFFEYI